MLGSVLVDYRSHSMHPPVLDKSYVLAELAYCDCLYALYSDPASESEVKEVPI